MIALLVAFSFLLVFYDLTFFFSMYVCCANHGYFLDARRGAVCCFCPTSSRGQTQSSSHLVEGNMEVERIFSAEQIAVHPELAKVIREYTKAVIRKAPIGTDEIVDFSAEYFKKKVDDDNAMRLAALSAGED
jgi:hypothetical protein